MPSKPLTGLLRSAGAFVIVLGILSAAPSQAQTAQRTLYGVCSYTLSNVVYLSNTLNLPANQAGQAGAAFHQYAAQHTGAVNPHCSWEPTADALNTQLKHLQSRVGTPGWPSKLSNSGWSYQPTAAATTQPGSARPYQQNQQARPYGAQNANYSSAMQNGSTGTAQNAANAGTGSASSSMGSSMGSAITGAGASAKQSVQSSATDAVGSATNSAGQMVTGGMTSLQNRLFHHGGKSQPADQAAAVPATTAAATPAAPATAAVATPAAALPAGAASASPAVPAAPDKPTIVDEGDGKHSILTLPGQSDAHELTLVSGTKNVYLEESTGDKYIVMPSGQITHIPHKNAAK